LNIEKTEEISIQASSSFYMYWSSNSWPLLRDTIYTYRVFSILVFTISNYRLYF